ncbi:MAG: hypothetical protein ACRDJN_11170, partial [Chloroflexota bacterium]
MIHTRLAPVAAAVCRRRVVLPLVAVLVGIYLGVLHPWLIAWGATAEEQHVVLPGDEAPPATCVTRAITINAPPAAVWPWLLAIGQDRAGFLSNDWLEDLTGADVHNAHVLRPEWRQRALGDKVPMVRPDIAGGAFGDAIYLPIEAIEPGRMITRVLRRPRARSGFSPDGASECAAYRGKGPRNAVAG